MSIQAKPGRVIVPSSESLTAQLDSAMRRFDADREQVQLRDEARAEARAARAWAAEAEAKGRRARWGV